MSAQAPPVVDSAANINADTNADILSRILLPFETTQDQFAPDQKQTARLHPILERQGCADIIQIEVNNI